MSELKPLKSHASKVPQANYMQFSTRGLVCLAIIIVELALLTVRFDTSPLTNIQHPIYELFIYSSKFLRFVICLIGAAIVLTLPRRKLIFVIIENHLENPRYWLWLLIHLPTIFLFYYLTWVLCEKIPTQLSAYETNIYFYSIVWALAGLLVVASLLFVTASKFFWHALFRSELTTLLVSIGAALLMLAIGNLFTQAWLPLANLTYYVSSHILSFFFQPIFSDPITNILGTEHFQVQIAPECSGYEGMGLIVVFIGLFIWIFRQQLRFPQVLLLFPLGICAAWSLNIIRIVALIGVGTVISPKIAAGGFHSNAGWIILIALFIFLVFIGKKITLFNKQAPEVDQLDEHNNSKAIALLMPFVVLMASILILSAMTADFDWLYPLKVIIGGLVLWRFRKSYQLYVRKLSYHPFIIGATVFLLWIALASTSQKVENIFSDTLFSQNISIVYAWLFFRILGSSLTVPIIEELAFRGYLIAKLVDTDFEKVSPGKFTWFSFLISSVLFGILHNEWLAGTLAGMLYAIAFYQRKELIDAVLAHMVTNIMLSVYVIYSGHWSLW